MRILVLAPRPPWPSIDGGRIAMARLSEGLARAGAEVRMLSLNPRKHRVDVDAPPLPFRAIDIDTSRIVGPMVGAIAHRRPYLIERFVSKSLARALREMLHTFDPDIVQIESPFLLPYVDVVRELSRARVVLRSLNVEFRIWETLADAERNPLRRFALRRVAASLRRYELATFDIIDALVPISRADANDFRTLGYTKPLHVSPCGLGAPDGAPAFSRPAPRTPSAAVPRGARDAGRLTAGAPSLDVGFIGSLDFRPNQEAVKWLIDELWPRVRNLVPDAHLSIAGSSPPDWLLQHTQTPGITILGRVEDAQEFMRSMSVIVAPLFAGGGMRIKVLEAMCLAKPIVATPLGAGGIDVTSDHDILIADDVQPFADSVVRLLRDRELAMRIGDAARDTVARLYDDDAIARDLLAFYRTISA